MSNNEEHKQDKVKYIYGASVQGIQDFIFQTNKLKEIVGASEIVAEICTTAFDDYEKNGESIVRAAGNIKYIFNAEEDCEKAVLHFPKKVMTMAPGITVSQAVVKLKEDLSDYAEQSNKLEKLIRAQRNRKKRSMTLGLMGIKRSSLTGLPAVDENEDGLIDEASLKKLEMIKNEDVFLSDYLLKSLSQEEVINANLKLAIKAFGDDDWFGKKVALNINDITDKNSWIAVIHADGNGLGNIFQVIGKHPGNMKKFSQKLDDITKDAAQYAFSLIKHEFSDKEEIPIRPVVLSGDDLTIICRADFALKYTSCFLERFEELSKLEELKELDIVGDEHKKVLEAGLTACAGIAFVKSSYPFHYAVDLAESLCSRAKEKSKAIAKENGSGLAPSCIMFYKVQDSFITDIKEIVTRTLMPQKNISLEFGPYYCGEHAASFHECSNTVDKLEQQVFRMRTDEGNAIKSALRQWLSMLFENVGMADQKMKRLIEIGDKKLVHTFNLRSYVYLSGSEEQVSIPFYDILSLLSLHITTKQEKEDEQ